MVGEVNWTENHLRTAETSTHGSPPQACAQLLLRLARETLVCAARGDALPIADPALMPEPLHAITACFATLRKSRELRGCIGNIVASDPLYRAVVNNTQAAALRDPRFPAVTLAEVPLIQIELSILSVPQPLDFHTPEDLLARLKPGTDGIVLKVGGRCATFLPQVWELLPRPEEFLRHLSRKTGLTSDAWRRRDAQVLVYTSEKLEESL